MNREKRTNVDFSKHVVTKTITDEVKIWKIAQPDTICYSIVFINCRGVLAVTGDMGNWIFCREFHPSADGYVSDQYWCQKASISSEQQTDEIDPEGIKKHIDEMIEENKTDEWRDDFTEEQLEYLQRCKGLSSCSEWEYTSFAYGDIPDGFDYDDVPMIKKTKSHLRAIFDGFDEICRRMEESEAK